MPLGKFVKDRPGGCLPPRIDGFQGTQDLLQVRGVAALADQGADFFVEGHQAHGVLLLEFLLTSCKTCL